MDLYSKNYKSSTLPHYLLNKNTFFEQLFIDLIACLSDEEYVTLIH